MTPTDEPELSGRRLQARLQRKTIFPSGTGTWTVELFDDLGTNVSNLLLERTPRNADPRQEAQTLLDSGNYLAQGPWAETGDEQWSMEVRYSR